jgi:hypothetical protein
MSSLLHSWQRSHYSKEIFQQVTVNVARPEASVVGALFGTAKHSDDTCWRFIRAEFIVIYNCNL